MKFSTRAIIEIERDRDVVFDYATAAENIPKYFRGAGVIPAVTKAYVLGNGPAQKGAVRRVITSDGAPLDEEILTHERPRTHHYKIKALRPPLRYLAKNVESEMIFSPIGIGTRVTWTYTIESASPLTAPAVALLTKTAFRRALESALANIKAAV